MGKHRVVTTDAEIDHAQKQTQTLPHELRVTGVEYKAGPGLDLFILKLNNGHRQLIPREDLQGLEKATKEQLAQVEIVGNGTGLRWPALDLDHYVPNLFERVYDTKR